MGQNRTRCLIICVLCVLSSVASSVSLIMSVNLYQKIMTENMDLIRQKSYCSQSFINLSLELEEELKTMSQTIDLIREDVQNIRVEIYKRVNINRKYYYFVNIKCKVDLLNSTLIQDLGKLNNLYDKTQDAVASIEMLSNGMDKKSSVIKQNGEINQIFSRCDYNCKF